MSRTFHLHHEHILPISSDEDVGLYMVAIANWDVRLMANLFFPFCPTKNLKLMFNHFVIDIFHNILFTSLYKFKHELIPLVLHTFLSVYIEVIFIGFIHVWALLLLCFVIFLIGNTEIA